MIRDDFHLFFVFLLFNVVERQYKKKRIRDMDENPLNRLKVVLVEKQKTSKWLSEQLGVSTVTVSKWYTNMHQTRQTWQR